MKINIFCKDDEEDQENEIEEDQEPNDTFPMPDEGILHEIFLVKKTNLEVKVA